MRDYRAVLCVRQKDGLGPAEENEQPRKTQENSNVRSIVYGRHMNSPW